MLRGVAFASVAVVLAIAGCNRGDGLKRVPVEGLVTASDVPVGGASVSFIPMQGTLGEGGIGTTDASGRYTLTGSREGDAGIVPGKYKVRVSRPMERDGTILPSDHKQADHPLATESVPAPYSSPDSPLEVTVPEDGGTVNVAIPVAALGKPS
jgi:hypothetical protein